MDAKEFIKAERERYRQTRPGEDYDAIHGERDREMLAREKKSEMILYGVMGGVMLAFAALMALPGKQDGETAAQEKTPVALKSDKIKFIPMEGGKKYRVEVEGTSLEEAKGAVAAFSRAHPNAKVSDFNIDSKSGKIYVDVTVEE
jgi:hypothetical protein